MRCSAAIRPPVHVPVPTNRQCCTQEPQHARSPLKPSKRQLAAHTQKTQCLMFRSVLPSQAECSAVWQHTRLVLITQHNKIEKLEDQVEAPAATSPAPPPLPNTPTPTPRGVHTSPLPTPNHNSKTYVCGLNHSQITPQSPTHNRQGPQTRALHGSETGGSKFDCPPHSNPSRQPPPRCLTGPLPKDPAGATHNVHVQGTDAGASSSLP